MKRKDFFGIGFIILAFFCIMFYPLTNDIGLHIKIGYTFGCLFIGAYFLK